MKVSSPIHIKSKTIEEDYLPLPDPSSWNILARSIPYVVVANETFPLKTNLLCPYPGRFIPGWVLVHLYSMYALTS